MSRPIFKKWGIAVLALLMLAGTYSDAFARSSHDRGRKEVVVVNRQRYHYRNGRFSRPGWFGLEFAIRIPPVGAVVTFLPNGRRTTVVRGVTYYYYDHVYYTACPGGYVVVPSPAVPATVLSGDRIIINVPNANGSYTAVTLVRQGSGYVGPQGEYYVGNPTIEQLRALYGK